MIVTKTCFYLVGFALAWLLAFNVSELLIQKLSNSNQQFKVSPKIIPQDVRK